MFSSRFAFPREKKYQQRDFFSKKREIFCPWLLNERERIDQMTTGLENIQRLASAS